MGLDMYLYETVFINGWNTKDYSELSNDVSDLNTEDFGNDPSKVDLTKLSGNPNVNQLEVVFINGKSIKWFDILKEVGYWRKCNQIHKWFVVNVQNGKDDCGYYFVSKRQLEELKNICEHVIKNKLLASTLLRFFFGSNEYDEDYFESLKYTVEILQKVLVETDFEKKVILYRSSW
jgi:hypothetical protein